MKLQTNTTPVPNRFFDHHLPRLTESELKVLLIVIRQTLGWKDQKTGKRKERDWIAGSQFLKKTGLSRNALSRSIKSLKDKGILKLTDYAGFTLESPNERRGKHQIFYTAFPNNAQNLNTSCNKLVQQMCKIST